MVAKKCCGSCENFRIEEVCPDFDGNVIEGFIDCILVEIEDFNKTENIDNCYSPRNPIQSKHEKMWNELKNHFIECFKKKENIYLIDILEMMHKLGEKHK